MNEKNQIKQFTVNFSLLNLQFSKAYAQFLRAKEKISIATSFFIGIFLKHYGSVFSPNPSKLPGIFDGYDLLEPIDSYWDKKFFSHNGLYKSPKGKKMIIKSLTCCFKNLKYSQISNEIYALQLMNNLSLQSKKMEIEFPQIIKYRRDSNKIFEVREYIEGVSLNKFDGVIMLNIVKKCIQSFGKLSESMDQTAMDKLPKRSVLFLAWTLPFYFFMAIAHDIKRFKRYFRLFALFYKLSFSSSGKYIFAHRDLHSGNIIINGKRIVVIDFEISALAEPETDIAIAARRYAKKLGPDLTKKLIFDCLATGEASRKNFLRLTIFYALQLLTIEAPEREHYKETQSYLIMLEKDIIPGLFPEWNYF